MYALSNKHYDIVSWLENIKGATKHLKLFENDYKVAGARVRNLKLLGVSQKTLKAQLEMDAGEDVRMDYYTNAADRMKKNIDDWYEQQIEDIAKEDAIKSQMDHGAMIKIFLSGGPVTDDKKEAVTKYKQQTSQFNEVIQKHDQEMKQRQEDRECVLQANQVLLSLDDGDEIRRYLSYIDKQIVPLYKSGDLESNHVWMRRRISFDFPIGFKIKTISQLIN